METIKENPLLLGDLCYVWQIIKGDPAALVIEELACGGCVEEEVLCTHLFVGLHDPFK